MLIPLADARRANAGSKAAALGALLNDGLPIPDGFVVPPSPSAGVGNDVPQSLREDLRRALDSMGDPVVVVRSSAASEDSGDASAAGQYESVIGAQGVDAVCAAIATCWASTRSARVEEYWAHTARTVDQAGSDMAVLVQQIIRADASGVMFTAQHSGAPTRIEASWGLGLSVVGGTVTPDTYEVSPGGSVRFVIGSKQHRADLHEALSGHVISQVSGEARSSRVLDDNMARALVDLGRRTAMRFDGPQDIEWAMENGRIWIVQARPVTAPLPVRASVDAHAPSEALTGVPASAGQVTASARVVCGPSDFSSVTPGDIVVCPYTDPAWTPLFSIAAGVVTETGGVLSHAAIVAREYGIPAILGVTDATTRLKNGERIRIDGSAGTITRTRSE